MDARFVLRSALASVTLTVCLFGSAPCQAETFKTANFVVTAPTAEIAQQVAETAEMFRRELAIDWLGHPLENWYRPCPIQVKVGQLGAGGSTTFTFDRGEVFGWKMEVQGTLERILDSVIPHEVNHTIFACHFRRPLPRWADEGAATLVEHVSERKRQEDTLANVVKTSKRIPLQELLNISEYPSDRQQVYTLYAEGYSLADFLVAHMGDSGRAVFLNFLADADKQDWPTAIKKHYGFKSVAELEKSWTGWVLAGSPRPRRAAGEQLAGPATPPSASTETSSIRGSSDDLGMSPDSNSSAVTPDRRTAALPPLPTITRGLRKSRESNTVTAPQPGELQESIVRGQSPSDLAPSQQPVGRVVPRRDQHPDLRNPGVSRLESIQKLMADQPRRDLYESARSLPSTALPRTLPTNPQHRWLDHNQFPSTRPSASFD
ncbi:MAG: hypothetical protein R3C01_00655 [Planctomycetaceae bacterium]